MQIPVSTTKPFVGLWGPDLGSELFRQTNSCNTGPFGIRLRSMNWSLTWSSMGGCWNQVSTPLWWMWCRFIPTRPAFTQVTSHSVPPFSSFVKCYNWLSSSPNQGMRCFCVSRAANCDVSKIRLSILFILLTDLNYLHVGKYSNLCSLNQYSYTHSCII